jgi:general secretion pathway protein G
MKRRTRKAGFTLIEVILVLGILVVMASVTAVVLWPTAKGARIQAAQVQIQTLGGQLDIYSTHIGHYPTEEEGGLRALLLKPNFSDPTQAGKWFGPYIKADQLKDPWGNDLHYAVSQAGTPEAEQVPYKLWSSGPDGVDGNEDDIKNWSDATAGGP